MQKYFSSVVFSMVSVMACAAEITIAYKADPVSMDPTEQLSGSTLQMANLVYDPLVRWDIDLNIEGRLAECWEEISPTVLRFHLRKGVRFHNGDAMTADDVVFTFDRLKKSSDYKGLYEPFEKMRKVDEHTVDLIMKKPYPLALAAMNYLFVMDSKYFSGKDDDGNDKARIGKASATFATIHENGSGPFVLDSREQGVKSRYRRFPGYWAETGNVDVLDYVTIKEDATRVSAVLSGDVDWIYQVPPNDVERVKKAPELRFYSLPSDRIITFQMNQEVVPEFRDKRVRLAVIYAVDNAGIVEKVMRGDSTVAAQLSPPGYNGYNPELEPRHDLDKARRLMREAGVEQGFTITMLAPNNRYVNDEKIAYAVAAMLAKINIEVKLTTIPQARFWAEYPQCKVGMAMIGWASDTWDSANYSEYLTMTKNAKTGLGQYNCGGYSNPELDRLLGEARTERDTEKRDALLKKISRIEYEEALFVPLYYQNLNWLYHKSFRNFPQIVNTRAHLPYWGDLVVEE